MKQLETMLGTVVTKCFEFSVREVRKGLSRTGTLDFRGQTSSCLGAWLAGYLGGQS